MSKRKLGPGEAWAVRVSERSGRAPADLVLLVMAVRPATRPEWGFEVECLTLESTNHRAYPAGAMGEWGDGAFAAPNKRLA